ncbi:MAG: acetyl-CoA carboxylase, carboxyltransferase subunit beta [Planctomycetota bacterium]|jgi:acetyl-CoA carboxylase carboxyl transferase subunit beta
MAFFRKKKEIPLGLWMKCPDCGKMVFTKTVEQNLNVCPECDFHMKVSASTRVRQILDEGSFEAIAEDLAPRDVLRFTDTDSYEAKLKKTQTKSGVNEAALAGRALLGGREVTVFFMDFGFMGGSMGVVVGEKFAVAAEDALERKAPLLVIATSGGARMHEGALSLMQMAKTSAAVAHLREAAVPYLTVLADPCTGGVSASFAAQGDVTLAEPGALIGFAGPRVIQGTIKASLPEGFQRAEFLLEHGYIDRIVHRKDLREELGRLIDFLQNRPPEAASTDDGGTGEAEAEGRKAS